MQSPANVVGDGRRTLLRVTGVSKTFPGTKALDDVDLDIRAGEVHALVGHNGSGKSTLIKVLSGYHHPDPGAQAWLDGEPVDIAELGPRHARPRRPAQLRPPGPRAGPRAEHDRQPGPPRRLRPHSPRPRPVARAGSERPAGCSRRSPSTSTSPSRWPRPHRSSARSSPSPPPCRAGTPAGGVLVLDEPTAVLPPGEVERLFKIVRDLRGTGRRHPLRLAPARRDLRASPTGSPSCATASWSPPATSRGLTKGELVHLMLGVEMEPDYRAEVPEQAEHRAAARGAAAWPASYLRDTTFTLHEGEVLGIAGLPDSGRDELPRLLTDRPEHASGGPGPARPDRRSGPTSRGGRPTSSRSCRPTAAARASSAR